MDVLESLKLREWVNEFHDISNRRIVAHELNNYLTPLAMQVSMLKNNLGSNQLGKAIERVAKLEKSLGKLKDFSLELLTENIFSNEIEYLNRNPEIKRVVATVAQMPEFKDFQLKWVEDTFTGNTKINPKILTLFVYTSLREQPAHADSGSCKISLVEDEDGKLLVTLRFESLLTPSSANHKPSSFDRLMKIVNTSHSSHRISRLPNALNSGVLSIDPLVGG